MRKFFCLSAGLTACSIAGLASADGPKLQPLDNTLKVDPIRVAGLDPDGNRITPWIYLDGQNDAPCGRTIVFDAFEPVPGGGAPTGATDCNPNFSPATRWFFGPSYCNLTVTNDMILATCAGNPEFADRIQFAWYWYGDGNPSGSETCIVNVFHFEDWDDCVSFGNAYPGFAFDFGELQTNPGFYFWTEVTTLCDLNLALHLPADAEGGAYQIQFRQDNQGTPATCAQPMIWGQKDPTGCEQGNSGVNQWDDDNPANGIYSFNECYTYSALCPDDNSLSAMYVCYGQGCLTLEVDQLIAGETSTFTITQTPGMGGSKAAVVWGLSPGSDAGGPSFGYCYDFDIASVTLVGQGTYVAGVATVTKFLPMASRGLNVYFQATEHGTCPDVCKSGILNEVIR